jgi:hypothetical protein
MAEGELNEKVLDVVTMVSRCCHGVVGWVSASQDWKRALSFQRVTHHRNTNKHRTMGYALAFLCSFLPLEALTHPTTWYFRVMVVNQLTGSRQSPEPSPTADSYPPTEI